MFVRVLVSFFILFSLPIIPTANADSSVVDYYHELQQKKDLSLDYQLVHKSGTWITFNQAWGTAIRATVDIDNGYIFFSDEGTGGGNYDTQVQLYSKSNQPPLVGIVENGYNPPYPDDIKVRFFTRIDGRWGDETSWVWPDVAIDDFLTAEMTIKDLRVLKAIGSQVYVKLPHMGAAPIAYLVINKDITKAVCSGGDRIKVADKSPYLHYCQHLKNQIYNKIDIVWNKLDGRFRIAGKSIVFTLWGGSASTSLGNVELLR